MSNDSDSGGDGFMLMFVTLSLILLAFFILLNSLSVKDEEKSRKAIGSLLGTFGILPGGVGAEKTRITTRKGKDVIGLKDLATVFSQVSTEIEKLISQLSLDSDQLSMEVDEASGEVKIVMADELMFASGGATISPRVFSLLDKLAITAKKAGGEVQVFGHTDHVSVRSSKDSSNWELSLERGTSVARYLEAAGPFASGRVVAGGASHYQPRATGRTAADLAKNRRVEIFVKIEQETQK
jgi:chemotaxis protein MotB